MPETRRQLGVFDAVCIIVGIVIGTGVYETPYLVANQVPSAAVMLGVWLVGGVITLLGALCYAELASTFPAQGGDYRYLSDAYGYRVGFLFSWAQLWVVRPGSIGAMAYVFGRNASELFPLTENSILIYAAASVVGLTAVNALGVREGKWTQNGLSVVKTAGLVAISAMGLLLGQEPVFDSSRVGTGETNLGRALIFVMFTYGGWHEMSFVGAELKNPARNVLRSLLLGAATLASIYIAVNAAFLCGLGLPQLREVKTPAIEITGLFLGSWAGRAVAVLICVSTLSAINGMIFTGSRIYSAFGADYETFTALGSWSKRGTPLVSLTVQGVITLLLIVSFGIWWGGEHGFEAMVDFSTPVYWAFFSMVCPTVFVLRRKYPNVQRPYRVSGYPIVPLLFLGSSLFVCYSSLTYAVSQASWKALWSVLLMLLGIGFAWLVPAPKAKA